MFTTSLCIISIYLELFIHFLFVFVHPFTCVKYIQTVYKIHSMFPRDWDAVCNYILPQSHLSSLMSTVECLIVIKNQFEKLYTINQPCPLLMLKYTCNCNQQFSFLKLAMLN